MRIAVANSAVEITNCFPVMRELRPHLTPAEFTERVRRQSQQSYRLGYLEDNGIKAVAGFRLLETLAWGRILYVDDLVTVGSERGKGYGATLLEWLLEYAKTHACGQLHLDSGVQRFSAHRFYFRQRLEITSYHFAVTLR